MLHKFYLKDKNFKGFCWGTFCYDDVSKTASFKFSDGAYENRKKAPIALEVRLEVGLLEWDDFETRRFVCGRIAPPERPGMQEDMLELGETSYNPYALYIDINGYTVYDETYLERIID